MKRRYYVVFEGRVQNVGFRWTVQQIAQSLGCTGWIRNLDNGNVDMQIQGDIDIHSFIQRVQKNYRWIRIDDYSIMEIAVDERERRFQVSGYF